ncbi:MAG: DNA repair protein RecN [Magnetococcales bacterium]|nr:DNA repair protein RecN [Magnetococcales bacterium]
MLNQLTIKNIALIDQLSLDLNLGLTILTGETGAGKSIILDALSLVLGRRADSTLIRNGADKAMVTACFQLKKDHPAQLWLNSKDLESDEDILTIRRVIGVSTPSRAYINETTVPLATLLELGSLLVEIHGQHDQQILMNNSSHLAILDSFANHGELLGKLKEKFDSWQRQNSELESLQTLAKEAFERRDYLAFQLDELTEAAIIPGELLELEKQKTRLAHANQLLGAGNNSIALLTGHGDGGVAGAADNTNQAAGELEGVCDMDPTLVPIAESLRSLHYELEDIVERIEDYRNSLEINPDQLDSVEERIDLINRLSRKHHKNADELEQLAQQWREELDTIDNADERIATAQKEIAITLGEYRAVAKKLTASRMKGSRQLTKEVEKQLCALHMANTRLTMKISPHEGYPRPGGMEDGQFLVSTNRGESEKPLKQVASGGELSRIMLALKTVMADLITSTTLIFDEVDVGVGGRVAASIGEKLAHVAKNRQVLTITHLPQVAAWGSYHLKVEKNSSQDKTRTSISTLDQENRIEELARMLAGNRVTAPARKNAKDLLQSCKTN